MTKLQKAQLAFLEETVAYYSEDPTRRATLNSYGACAYITKDGRKCAIGRHITNFYKIENGDSIHSADIMRRLPRRIQNLGNLLLTSVQALHDLKDNWTDIGLSLAGETAVKSIKNFIEFDRNVNT